MHKAICKNLAKLISWLQHSHNSQNNMFQCVLLVTLALTALNHVQIVGTEVVTFQIKGVLVFVRQDMCILIWGIAWHVRIMFHVKFSIYSYHWLNILTTSSLCVSCYLLLTYSQFSLWSIFIMIKPHEFFFISSDMELLKKMW